VVVGCNVSASDAGRMRGRKERRGGGPVNHKGLYESRKKKASRRRTEGKSTTACLPAEESEERGDGFISRCPARS